MFNITPKEDKFYNMLTSNSKTVYEISKEFKNFIHNLNNAEELFEKMKEIEHYGDKQQHKIIEELNKTFITPLDREDIYTIAKNIDDIIDLIESTASRFVVFDVKSTTEETYQFVDMIIESCSEVTILVENLKNVHKSTEHLHKSIVEINRIEELGDKLLRQALRKLFTNGTPAIEVIKWREIYECLENTLDACEKVANQIEEVVMKNA